ncbi:hypothetical protein B0O80DRAFT_490163 [Mortierella sp. GBAus27b]|nr:hypothetical protein B0O80DRAFT_490163 [Mortierella sp. GBAus27b]
MPLVPNVNRYCLSQTGFEIHKVQDNSRVEQPASAAIEQENTLLNKLGAHEHIARYGDLETRQSGMSVISLKQWLLDAKGINVKSSQKKIEDAKLMIINHIAKGLTFIHDGEIVHGNIKSANILIVSESEPSYDGDDMNICAKISGFDKVTIMDKASSSKSQPVVDILDLCKLIEDMFPKKRTMPGLLRAWCARCHDEEEDNPTVQELMDAYEPMLD